MKSTKEKRITVRLTPEQYESICEKAEVGTKLWWYRGWTS